MFTSGRRVPLDQALQSRVAKAGAEYYKVCLVCILDAVIRVIGSIISELSMQTDTARLLLD